MSRDFWRRLCILMALGISIVGLFRVGFAAGVVFGATGAVFLAMAKADETSHAEWSASTTGPSEKAE